jgi:multiple sugar transport system ATP-binding protein
MAQIVLDQVDKTFAHGVQAVHDLSLEIPDGEFMVLVGPSGCGKSTALRIIAGLEDITRGTLQIGDRIVNNLPPKDRDIAMIFQNYALYPQMTVAQNMAFGLQMRKTPKSEIVRRVQNAAKILGLEPRCPAASASAWRWAGRSCGNRKLSSWTNRCRTSTPSCVWACGHRWRNCMSGSM